MGASPAVPRVVPSTREVLVLVSHDSEPYQQAVGGIRQALAGAKVHVVPLRGDVGAGRSALAGESVRPGAVVIAVGGVAIEAAVSRSDVPVVAAMALRDRDVPRVPHMTGVHLELPPALHLRWLRRALPAARSVAVLYSPGESAAMVERLHEDAAREGLRLDAVPAPGPRDIPRGLERAVSSDVLLGITDAVVFTPQTARGILLMSFRHRVPLVGLPASWVEAGALFGLERDYADIGRQAAEMAERIRRGATPASIPRVGPRQACFVANLRTAEHMRIELPAAMVQQACAVFR